MPFYFFHCGDDAPFDSEGTELTDVYIARIELVRFTAEIVRDQAASFWMKGGINVETWMRPE